METDADVEAAVSLQLIDQTSHLALDYSGAREDRGTSSPWSPPAVSAPPISVPGMIISISRPGDAQPHPQTAWDTTGTPLELAHEGGSEEGQPHFGECPGASAVSVPPHLPSHNLGSSTASDVDTSSPVHRATMARHPFEPERNMLGLPNEVLLQILGYLDVCDLLATSRVCHRLRDLSLAPILHVLRLRRVRATLSPLLNSPFRPSLADLISRSIFLTHTTAVSRRLARSLVCIRLSRRLAARPSPEALVQRCVLPPECVPGRGPVAPALVARKRAVERERVKDGLRRWIDRVWRGEVQERAEGVRKWEEKAGVGRVWRMRRFWERVGKGEA